MGAPALTSDPAVVFHPLEINKLWPIFLRFINMKNIMHTETAKNC